MKRIPLTIIIHTNKIPFSDYGDISFLGETMSTPIMRCRFCGVQPEVEYYNQKQLFRIYHVCKINNSNHTFTSHSYEELAEEWNQKRGRKYE